MPFVCHFVNDPQVMAAAREVRRQVFIVEQHVPEEEEWDSFDATAAHFVLWLGDRVVGTGRLVEQPGGWFKIGRVAVLPESRRQGGGTCLMQALMASGAARGAVAFRLDAQLTALPFYERLGFVAEGEEFLDAGIPHRRMTRRVEEP